MPQRRRKTKKEERDNRPGLALEKPRLPAPPGRASVGGGEPVRPVPGASEWDPLARVRRGVRKPFLAATSRRTEQGELLRHVRRPRQHRGTLGAVEARRRRGEGRAAARKQPCGRDGGSQHEIVSALRTTAAPDAGRAPAGRRHARHRRRWNLRARTTRSRAPWRRAGEPRRSPGAAATRRRRGSAGRPDGAAGRSGTSGAKTTWRRLSSHRAEATSRCRDSREQGEAQRLCQPTGVTSVAGRPVNFAVRGAAP